MNEQAKNHKQENRGDTNGSVLLSDEIIRLSMTPTPLIDPFHPEKEKGLLKPASYHLRIGDKIRIEGEDHELSSDNSVQHIPPHGLAIIRTYERVNMPPDLIGRWNLKVKKVYEGLVWVGGPQVDPQYSGFLFCPVYNLSDRPYKIVYKEPLFTVDFVRTTRFDTNNPNCVSLELDRLSDSLGAIDRDRIRSAPKRSFETQDRKIEEMEKAVGVVQQDMKRFHNTLYAVLAMIITAIAVIATLGATEVTWDANWILSVFALVLAGMAIILVIRRAKK